MNGIPKLGGLWLRAYRLAWALALLSALAAVVVDQHHALAPARLLHAILLVAAAALLFRRRPTDPVAAMLSVAFLLWAITRSLAWLPMGEGGVAIALLDKLRFALFVSGMLLFPSGRFEPRWTIHAMASIGAVALFGIAVALGAASPALHAAMSMTCAAVAVMALHWRFRGLPPGVQRQQIKWVAFGLAAGLALVAISRLTNIALLFDAGVIVMALGILAALLRYRLYDADAAIGRSTVYAALTVALLAIFAACETVIQTLSLEWFGNSASAVSGGVAAALAAGLMAPLHWRVSQWAEGRFQKGLAALRRDLPSALADLRETVGLTRLAETVLAHIEPAARSSRAALLLGGRVVASRHVAPEDVASWMEGWSPGAGTALACDDEDPVFPCRVPLRMEGAGLIGWMLVGGRPDGSPQGKDEREALAESAGPIARALWIVARREADEARRDELVATLQGLERSLPPRLRSLRAPC